MGNCWLSMTSLIAIIIIASITTLLTITFIYSNYNFFAQSKIIYIPEEFEVDLNVPKGYAIYTIGCKIQDFDPFDKSFSKLLEKQRNLNCSKLPSLLNVKSNTIVINFDALNVYGGYLDYCLYYPIFRFGNGESDDKYYYGGDGERFYDNITVKHEFVKVECHSKSKLIYLDFFPFILKKLDVERRCNMKQEDKNKSPRTIARLSIALVGIDSTSRLNFMRYCPKTRSYLLNNMNAIELKGYNKVGDNTFQNLVPMFHGTYIAEMDWIVNEPFDKFSFIWKNYYKKGYRTVFAEDDPVCSTFNYIKRGFYYPPADYYLRPFYRAVFESQLYAKGVTQCLGNRMHTNVILDYAYDFVKTFKNDLYFSFFFMSNLTHGETSKIRYGDKAYYDFLKKSNEQNILNNTILFFFSDHGLRFGKFRASYVGRLEERLPMFYLVFPTWFRKKYPNIIKTVKENSIKLSTPFDIHETLKDLLHFTGEQRNYGLVSQRGISLFDEIPEERTCEDASILPHWCTCQEKTKLSNDNKIVKKSAKYIIDQINLITENNRDICVQLTMDYVIEAWFNTVNINLLKYSLTYWDHRDGVVKLEKKPIHDIKDITILLEAKPSNAQFEATIRYDETSGLINLTGEISRINEYGDQSICVQDYTLRKYCYCKKNLK